MGSSPISRRAADSLSLTGGLLEFIEETALAQEAYGPDACDFVFGNPQEMPLQGFVDALQRGVVPQDKSWFAYKMSEEEPRQVVAEGLLQRRGVTFDPEDILLTNGAFGGLAVVLTTVLDPGDEVVFISPPWFLYEAMITAAGGVPVRVKATPESFDLDLAAIQAAISPRTRAIIVNSPNNPTGKVYTRETLDRLGELLSEASERSGRTIYLLSDEAYHRILFDGRSYPSPTESYPHSFLIYTYGKTLLTPGQRLGFIALPPSMPDRERIRDGVTVSQVVSGWTFPNALLQHALGDIEKLSIDISHLQRKRDRMVEALRAMGYQLHSPEGTFYLLPRAPIPDDQAFLRLLAKQGLFAMPGAMVECPGYFRLSLTASDDMIDRALPGFQQAMELATRERQSA